MLNCAWEVEESISPESGSWFWRGRPTLSAMTPVD